MRSFLVVVFAILLAMGCTSGSPTTEEERVGAVRQAQFDTGMADGDDGSSRFPVGYHYGQSFLVPPGATAITSFMLGVAPNAGLNYRVTLYPASAGHLPNGPALYTSEIRVGNGDPYRGVGTDGLSIPVTPGDRFVIAVEREVNAVEPQYPALQLRFDYAGKYPDGRVSSGTTSTGWITGFDTDYVFRVTFAEVPTTSTITASTTTPVFGETVRFTTTVAASNGAQPTGTVAFSGTATAFAAQTLTNSGGAWSSSVEETALTPGTHTIAASYSGDRPLDPSKGSVSVTVRRASSTTEVTTSHPSVPYGAAVTFDITVKPVAPSIATPEGTVNLVNSIQTFCILRLVNGKASCTVTPLMLMTDQPMVAQFYPDTGFSRSTGSVLQTVTPMLTSVTSFTASPSSPSLVQKEVTFTAAVGAVAPSTGVVTGGKVHFDVEGGVAGGYDVALATDATAQLAYTFDSASAGAPFKVTARYVGAGDSANSNNTLALAQVVNKLGTSVSFTSPAPSTHVTYGSSQTFVARVTTTDPGSAAVGSTNKVDFFYTATGGTLQELSKGCKLTPATTPDANGRRYAEASSTVDCTTQPKKVSELPGLPPGSSYVITAKYDTGDDLHLAASPAELTPFVIDPLPATTTLASDRAKGSTFGEPVTFTASVTGTGFEPPEGAVTFFDGTTALGGPTALDSAHRATLTTRALAATTHSIRAVFASGSDSYLAGTEATLAQVVNKADTTVIAFSSTNPGLVGNPVTFNATVRPVDPGATPSGASDLTTDATVVFKEGATLLGTGTLVPGSTTLWTLTLSSLSVGTHVIDVVYSGNASFNGSSASTGRQEIHATGTSASIASSSSATTFGDVVTFTAHVETTSGGVPTGTVTFKDGLGTSLVTLATIPLDLSTGFATATFTTSKLAGGLHGVGFVYDGDANHLPGATASLAHTVRPAATTTGLRSARNPSVTGETVKLTAVVTSPAGVVEDGTVTFRDNGFTIATVDAASSAVTASTALGAGSHQLSATYNGGGSFASSTGQLTQTVGRGATTLTVSSSTNPSPTGSNVTFTALVKVVAPAMGTPKGTVTFMDAARVLGTAPIGTDGLASFRTASLEAGAHAIQATFTAEGAFEPSSGSVSQVVDDNASNITLSSSPSPSTFGALVTIRTSFTAPAGAPTGAVAFTARGATIGQAAIDGQGHATITTTALPVGTSTITATYAGDGRFLAGIATTDHVVTKGRSTTTLTTTESRVRVGANATFSAVVTGATTGLVDFIENGKILGSSTLEGGRATLASTTLAIGAHSVVARFVGSETFLGSTSSPVIVDIEAAPPPTGDTPDGGNTVVPPVLTPGASSGCMQAPASRRDALAAGFAALAVLLLVRRQRAP